MMLPRIQSKEKEQVLLRHLAFWPKSRLDGQSFDFFFLLVAAWLNEGRCPGGRLLSAKTKWRVANSMEICFLESNKHQPKQKR